MRVRWPIGDRSMGASCAIVFAFVMGNKKGIVTCQPITLGGFLFNTRESFGKKKWRETDKLGEMIAFCLVFTCSR